MLNNTWLLDILNANVQFYTLNEYIKKNNIYLDTSGLSVRYTSHFKSIVS